MIATFHRWTIRPGSEAAFRAGWSRATAAYRTMGSLGSSLWRAADGDLCAFALWPDRPTRAAAFASAEGAAFLAELAPLVVHADKVDLDPLDLQIAPDAFA